MNKFELSNPNQDNAPEAGETYLSIKCVEGNLYVVDQHGKMINGLISCEAKTSTDEFTIISLSCHSHKVD